jgi:hypothetical protein
MKKESYDMQDAALSAANDGENGMLLPLVALGLELLPVLIVFVGLRFRGVSSALLLIAVALPIIGFVIAIQSLCLMKKRGGLAGKLIAGVAVALPPVFVVSVVLLFLGAVSSGVSHM